MSQWSRHKLFMYNNASTDKVWPNWSGPLTATSLGGGRWCLDRGLFWRLPARWFIFYDWLDESTSARPIPRFFNGTKEQESWLLLFCAVLSASPSSGSNYIVAALSCHRPGCTWTGSLATWNDLMVSLSKRSNWFFERWSCLLSGEVVRGLEVQT